jgi:hypothetical protein
MGALGEGREVRRPVLVVDPSRPGTAEGGASAGVDNGREFIAASVVSWLAEQKVKAAFIEIA